jgi:thiamine biosynthesis lipoprotein
MIGLDLEKKLSIYYPDSEIVALNKTKKMQVSTDLFEVLGLALEVSERTGGAFDVTVAPVLKAKGFYKNMPVEISDSIPDKDYSIGWKNIKLGDDGKTVELLNGVWIDLSGIAKGYIVDAMSEYLKTQRYECCLVNAGGEIRCGEKSAGEPWKIGVKRPGKSGTVATLILEDKAVATSGDYENFIVNDANGKTMSHIIDPSKDEPVEGENSGVTVIADTCAYADGLATAMMVMGKDNAITLAEKLGDADVVFVEEGAEGEKITCSKGADEYLAEQPRE